jgi:apolipoprotein N-acyltransferase
MTWSAVSHISPVGRILNWSPVSTSHAYGWLLPYTGPLGVDWAVAACAVLSSEVAAMWLMGSNEEEQLDQAPTSGVNQVPSTRRSRNLLTLGILLAALTLPSFFVNLPTRIDTSFNASPLGVACALPAVRKGSHPALSDFITETRKLTSLAKVVLWPESAVSFNSQEEREDAFERLRKDIQHSLIGVAFEEFVTEEPSNPTRMKRNGLALIHGEQKKGDEVIQYYKRNLVPCTSLHSNAIFPGV